VIDLRFAGSTCAQHKHSQRSLRAGAAGGFAAPWSSKHESQSEKSGAPLSQRNVTVTAQRTPAARGARLICNRSIAPTLPSAKSSSQDQSGQGGPQDWNRQPVKPLLEPVFDFIVLFTTVMTCLRLFLVRTAGVLTKYSRKQHPAKILAIRRGDSANGHREVVNEPCPTALRWAEPCKHSHKHLGHLASDDFTGRLKPCSTTCSDVADAESASR